MTKNLAPLLAVSQRSVDIPLRRVRLDFSPRPRSQLRDPKSSPPKRMIERAGLTNPVLLLRPLPVPPPCVPLRRIKLHQHPLERPVHALQLHLAHLKRLPPQPILLVPRVQRRDLHPHAVRERRRLRARRGDFGRQLRLEGVGRGVEVQGV